MKGAQKQIEKIRVYNPRVVGIDYAGYRVMCALSTAAAHFVHKGMASKALESDVAPGITLDTYLHGPEGYFATHPAIGAVVFVDGKFHSRHDQREARELDLDQIARETGAIPLAFTHDSAIEAMLAEREATESIMAAHR